MILSSCSNCLIPRPCTVVALAYPFGGGGGHQFDSFPFFMGTRRLFVCVSAACALRCKCSVCPQGNELFHMLCRTLGFFFAISAMNFEHNGMFPVHPYIQFECILWKILWEIFPKKIPNRIKKLSPQNTMAPVVVPLSLPILTCSL